MSNAGIWQESSPYSKLLITVGVVLLSVVAFASVAMALAALFFNLSYEELKTLTTVPIKPENLPALKFVNTFTAIGAFVIPSFILAHWFSRNKTEYLSLNKGISLTDIFLVLTAIIASGPLVNYLVELNGKMTLPPFLDWLENWMQRSEAAATEVQKKFIDVNSTSELILNVILIALIPAIGEELLFRGIVQRIFIEWSKSALTGILISAAVFSAAHTQFYGFLPRMLLGVILGYMFFWSGSLWLPIAAHFINNAATVILLHLYHNGSINIDPDKVGAESDSFSALVIGTLFLVAALWLLYKKYKPGRIEAR